VGNQLYDPLTTRQLVDGTWVRDPIPGNIIPQSRFDSAAAKLISLNPWVAPNTAGSLTSTGPVSNYTWESRSRTFYEDYSGRVDHQVSPELKLYASYTYNHLGGLQRPTSIAIPAFDGANGIITPSTQGNLSVGGTRLFGPSALNDVRLGYYRVRSDTFVPSYDQNWAGTLGIPNVSPLLMPSFSSTMASGNSSAPALNTMYGLTVPAPPIAFVRPFRCATISAR
jgi:hypothetical protein